MCYKCKSINKDAVTEKITLPLLPKRGARRLKARCRSRVWFAPERRPIIGGLTPLNVIKVRIFRIRVVPRKFKSFVPCFIGAQGFFYFVLRADFRRYSPSALAMHKALPAALVIVSAKIIGAKQAGGGAQIFADTAPGALAIHKALSAALAIVSAKNIGAKRAG